ncbi:MAG: exodeoxyribonuclease VII small subunit [Eubacteriales bacterium]|jgi:exodeoxyribonuclease VII small subunit|nr:exodeoxyribonuclease VII small subunit [Lachnospiraceae bacterium]MDD5858893.1 exodeoxyribonuclease VII small subunit [Eubacteriales bacterium]MCH4064830.1 exodeoxyribonuclease VII small subunit [Lachnospiraceae bacterium]MCH4103806.1 exodeoxyribonuclease VII small subunit [Lachnospiraceae bacterium]MCI1308210.1 exodeoxyribonuclease VII small subunit [Lachnospiraceae bacterium]
MENKTQKNEEGTEQLTVEESFARLDEMVKRLESEDVPLEESFRLYQEGMKLLKDVSGRIMTYEKKMQVLSGDGTLEDLD